MPKPWIIWVWLSVRTVLKESETRLQLLAENAQDLIYRYRLVPDPGFDYVSPASQAMTGYTPDDFYAGRADGLNLVPALEPAAFQESDDVISVSSILNSFYARMGVLFSSSSRAQLW